MFQCTQHTSAADETEKLKFVFGGSDNGRRVGEKGVGDSGRGVRDEQEENASLKNRRNARIKTRRGHAQEEMG